jgi:hypothetical protein
LRDAKLLLENGHITQEKYDALVAQGQGGKFKPIGEADRGDAYATAVAIPAKFSGNFDRGVLWEGYLDKKGSFLNKGWKRRFFVCYDQTQNFAVKYYADVSKKKAKGELGGGQQKCLAGYKLAATEEDRTLKLHTKRQVSTVTGDKARRVWWVRAKTGEEFEAWSFHLNQACKNSRAGSDDEYGSDQETTISVGARGKALNPQKSSDAKAAQHEADALVLAAESPGLKHWTSEQSAEVATNSADEDEEDGEDADRSRAIFAESSDGDSSSDEDEELNDEWIHQLASFYEVRHASSYTIHYTLYMHLHTCEAHQGYMHLHTCVTCIFIPVSSRVTCASHEHFWMWVYFLGH